VEQRLAALFASVGNALDSTTYTYSDSDYLVRKALIEFLDQENALVASARKIPDSAEVVDSVLNYVVSTEFNAEDPADWYRKAMGIVVEFADLAHRNEGSEEASRFAALLPEGHPRAARVLSLTASAHREATASWISADPRLDEEAAAIVYGVYSATPEDFDDLDTQFNYLKLGALVSSGQVPEDLYPIVAAFNLTPQQRSAIATMLEPFRNRDRKGRFADEFGPVKGWFYSKATGFFAAMGRKVGPGSKPGTIISEFKDQENIPDGLYEQDMSKSEAISAILPESAVKGLKDSKEIVSRQDQRDAVDLDQFLATKRDAPIGWKRGKSEGGKARNFWQSLDGKFEAFQRGAERVKDVIGKSQDIAQAARDGIQWILNKDGKQVGTAENWADLQQQYYVNGGKPFPDQGMRIPDMEFVPQEREPQLGFDLPARPENPFGGEEEFRPFRDPNEPTLRVGRNEPDLDQDAKTSELTPELLGEGYNFSKADDNTWVQEGVGADGESYSVTKAPNGKWVVSESSGSGPDNFKDRDLESFDNAKEAFEFANDQGANPNEFDQDWVDELQKDQAGPDLDQGIPVSSDTIDRGMLSPEMAEKYAKELDDMDEAIANDDFKKINSLLERAALDLNLPDDVYSALYSAREVRGTRAQIVENAIAGGSKEDLESLLDDSKYSGWSDRIQDALAQDVDLDQDAPVLSEKQSEAASGKQYAFLDEFLAERQLDPATEQAFKDAIENKNLNKAQASALIGIGRSADFKPDVDPSKPSERMLNSLQGYLSSKDLTASETKEVLDSLQKDGSRDNVDALLNKLRRKKDKPVDLNQGAGSLTRHSDGSYEWEDIYNNVNVNNTSRGWEVEYTSPSMEDGVSDWYYKSFGSEEEALAFAEELIKQNQEDSGFGRAADNLFDRGGASADADLDQDAKGTLTDTATDKQWDFLQSLLDGKKITDPNLEAAVRSALEDRNLTKGEVGAFIGALRNLEDKPNARREPSAKQIASIKRALLERDMTPEERKSMQDKLAAGLSFDEASEMLNDLKKRDITPEGMDNLLSELKSEQDIETLRYLLDKPEYSKYRTDIKDTLRQLALDTEDPYLQEFIDAREDVDLDQDVFEKPSAGEISQEGRDIIDEIESAGPISDETDEEFRDRIQSYRDELDSFVARMRFGSSDLIESSQIRLDRDVSSSEIDGLLDDLEGLAAKARTRRFSETEVDLDQDVSRSVSRDDLANKLAEDIDAADIFLVNGDTIKEALKFFDDAKFTFSAGDMVKEIYEMADDLDRRNQPELANRARDLADRMFDEMLERFGFGDAGRYENGFDPVDLDDARDAIGAEREMFFETDVDNISDKLDENGNYGDNRSGGAEGRVRENEDGTFTASVDYDRDGEEQTFEDRDEAIAWAAGKIADYNSDVIPSSYQEDANLSQEASEARTPDQANAFADKLDAIADALDGNRGDPRLARSLRESAQNIRDAIARNEAQNQAGVPDEPTTPETMEEMATDPDLNPAGYAESVSDDLYRQFEAGQKMDPTSRMVSDKPEPGEYKSADGRVIVTVEADGDMDDGEMVDASYYSVKIDGVTVGTKSLNWSDEVAADIQQLVEEHFSKKA
jgi:hypothetical protein